MCPRCNTSLAIPVAAIKGYYSGTPQGVTPDKPFQVTCSNSACHCKLFAFYKDGEFTFTEQTADKATVSA